MMTSTTSTDFWQKFRNRFKIEGLTLINILHRRSSQWTQEYWMILSKITRKYSTSINWPWRTWIRLLRMSFSKVSYLSQARFMLMIWQGKASSVLTSLKPNHPSVTKRSWTRWTARQIWSQSVNKMQRQSRKKLTAGWKLLINSMPSQIMRIGNLRMFPNLFTGTFGFKWTPISARPRARHWGR